MMMQGLHAVAKLHCNLASYYRSAWWANAAAQKINSSKLSVLLTMNLVKIKFKTLAFFPLAFDVTEMRKEEASQTFFFSFGIVSRQEKMSAFVGKQVACACCWQYDYTTKLFLLRQKKSRKKFVYYGDSFFSCISIYNIHESLVTDFHIA